MAILLWAATQAGAIGVDDLGVRPGLSTGYYSKHFKLALGLEDEEHEIQNIPTAIYSKYAQEREFSSIPVIPPHEALAKAWDRPEEELRATYDPDDFCENFHEHPVVLAAGPENAHLVCGYAIYMDATPYTKQENFYGIYVVDLRFNLHHICAILIKSEFCKCGCKGWCTIGPIHHFIAHCCNAFAIRRNPISRHDGKAWEKHVDDARADRAGKMLPCWGACTQLRGDIPEICFTCGCKSYRTVEAPCPVCKCSRTNMFDYEACSVAELAWPELTHEEWEAECNRLTVHMTIQNKEEHMKVIDGVTGLAADGRKQKGAHGLAMQSNLSLAAGELRKGDRVECTRALLDPYAIYDLDTFPAEVQFWRTSEEVRLTRRCVLFDILGVCLALISHCSLHILDLGVVSRYVAFVLWFILLANPWNIPFTTTEVKTSRGLAHLRGELWQHYSEQRKVDPSSKTSQVHDLTIGMLGNKDNPLMHMCGGAEIRSLLPFVVAMLKKFKGVLPVNQTSLLERSGEALIRYYTITRQHGCNVPVDSVQAMFDCAISHNTLFEEVSGKAQPKSHMFVHMVKQSMFMGNPRVRSTINNESLNGTVAVLSRSVHRAVFMKAVLMRFKLLQRYAPQRMSGTCIRKSLL